MIDTDKRQGVDPWNEENFRQKCAHGKGNTSKQKVLGPVLIDLRRSAQNQNGGHEGDEQGYGGGEDPEGAVGHDELGRRPLTTSAERVVDADAEADDEEGDKHQVVGPFQCRRHVYALPQDRLL